MSKKIIVLLGVPDSNRVKVQEHNGSLRDLKTNIGGNASLNEYLESSEASVETLLLGGRSPKQISLQELPDLFVNNICDVDSNQKSLEMAEVMLDKLDVPIINTPEILKMTRRESIYELLSGIEGVHVPKTLRITPVGVSDIVKILKESEMAFPLIVREAGSHGGDKMLLLNDESGFDELEQFAFDGRDYYLSAFVNYRSDDGLYRKQRFIMVDGKLYPRHMIVAKNWKVHAASRSELMDDNVRYQEEEQLFLQNIPESLIKKAAKIYERLPLDFFGIDCHVDEKGEMLIFEVNACFRVFVHGGSGYRNDAVNTIVEAVNKMIEERLEDV